MISSSQSAIHLRITDNPSFKVTKMSYADGTLKTFDLKTSELLKSASIFARDLFTLNLTSRQERRRRSVSKFRRISDGAPPSAGVVQRSTVSEINPRASLIVLSFGNIRAVVGLDCVSLFDAHNPAVREFAHELSATYRSENVVGEPPELVFLECVLKDTVDSFNRRLRLFEPLVDSFLDKATEELYYNFVPTTWYSSLLPLQESLESFEIQAKKSLDCLTHLLENDDEMLSLLITEKDAAKQHGGVVDFSRHEDVELVIGVYARQINNVLLEIRYLLKRIQSKQAFVSLTMNAYRNRMVKMNMHIGIAALSLGFGTTIAGFFGMNLVSGLENSTSAFLAVVGLSNVGAMAIAAGSLHYASGRTMRKRATSRLEQTEIVSNALSDMSALDFTIKTLEKQGASLDKDQFRDVFEHARHSNPVSSEEIDLLFDVFDRVKDGYLRIEDFHPDKSSDKKK